MLQELKNVTHTVYPYSTLHIVQMCRKLIMDFQLLKQISEIIVSAMNLPLLTFLL